ncbi:MAG: hypothetical protein R2807_08720 [Chitinophagales bacterium]
MDNHKTTKAKVLKFQKIHGADFTNDPNMLLVPDKIKDKQICIYHNTLNSTTTQLNNDTYATTYILNIFQLMATKVCCFRLIELFEFFSITKRFGFAYQYFRFFL